MNLVANTPRRATEDDAVTVCQTGYCAAEHCDLGGGTCRRCSARRAGYRICGGCGLMWHGGLRECKAGGEEASGTARATAYAVGDRVQFRGERPSKTYLGVVTDVIDERDVRVLWDDGEVSVVGVWNGRLSRLAVAS